MGQLLEWKVGRALAATNRPKVENVKTSNRLIDKKTQVFCTISIIRALNAVGHLGDNLIRELTGQSDPKCKLSLRISRCLPHVLYVFCKEARLRDYVAASAGSSQEQWCGCSSTDGKLTQRSRQRLR